MVNIETIEKQRWDHGVIYLVTQEYSFELTNFTTEIIVRDGEEGISIKQWIQRKSIGSSIIDLILSESETKLLYEILKQKYESNQEES